MILHGLCFGPSGVTVKHLWWSFFCEKSEQLLDVKYFYKKGSSNMFWQGSQYKSVKPITKGSWEKLLLVSKFFWLILSGMYLEPSQTSTMELSCKNS